MRRLTGLLLLLIALLVILSGCMGSGQKAAPKNGPARLHCRSLAAQEGINAQRPAHAKNPQLRFVEIEAQKVQGWRQQEERHERALQPPSAALKGNPAPQRMQSGRRCVALHGRAARRLGFSPHHPPPHAPPHPVRGRCPGHRSAHRRQRHGRPDASPFRQKPAGLP